MNKEQLYKLMNIDKNDIQKGEKLYKSFSSEMRQKFLSDIYAEYQKEGTFKSIYYLYGEFPNFRKVILINFAIEGTDKEKEQLAYELSNPYNNGEIEDFFHLNYEWIKSTNSLIIFEKLSRGLLFYLDKNEVKDFYQEKINNSKEFAKGTLSWLYIQPNWFREKHLKQEIIIWNELKNKWENILDDQFKIREINKSLGLNIDKNEIWLHEIENPWNFSGKVIERLKKEGVDVQLNGYIGEVAMGSPLVTELLLNGRKIKTLVGGPFITDKNNSFLCCTTFSRKKGFKLVAIDLRTNEIIELHSSYGIYTPYKYENGEFLIIIGNNKIDLSKDLLRIKISNIKKRKLNIYTKNN